MATCLPVRVSWRCRHDPAFRPRVVNNRILDVLDRDGRIGDPQDTRAFARRRASATGELREIVGLVKSLAGFLPAIVVDQVVPFGDQIIDRTTGTGLAERNTAIHAPRPLFLQLLDTRLGVDFVVVIDANDGQSPRNFFAIEFLESSWLTHGKSRLKNLGRSRRTDFSPSMKVFLIPLLGAGTSFVVGNGRLSVQLGGCSFLFLLHLLQDTFVIDRHDFDAFAQKCAPVLKDFGRHVAARERLVAANHFLDLLFLFSGLDPLQVSPLPGYSSD